MTQSTDAKPIGHTGTLIVSALFVLAGIITLYDTTSYTDRDSQVFPQTVAVLLIITAAITFIRQILKPAGEEGFGRGSWWRRVLLMSTMFMTGLAMPMIGFLPAAAIAFAGGLIAAMHDRWTARSIVLYWGAGVVIMGAFFALFKYALHVPLP